MCIRDSNWGGKVYTPIVDVNPATLLWYRKSIIEENGFDDPWELFEKGEWTYDPADQFIGKAYSQRFPTEERFGDRFLEIAETVAKGRALADAG